jgi:hypothetical protein
MANRIAKKQLLTVSSPPTDGHLKFAIARTSNDSRRANRLDGGISGIAAPDFCSNFVATATVLPAGKFAPEVAVLAT